MEKMKIVKDGKTFVGTLVSYGFGAGWSTWNHDNPELVFDPTIVQLVLTNKPDYKDRIVDYCEKKYPDAYLGGIDGLDICWVEEGVEFMIDEYDGSESLVRKDSMQWLTA